MTPNLQNTNHKKLLLSAGIFLGSYFVYRFFTFFVYDLWVSGSTLDEIFYQELFYAIRDTFYAFAIPTLVTYIWVWKLTPYKFKSLLRLIWLTTLTLATFIVFHQSYVMARWNILNQTIEGLNVTEVKYNRWTGKGLWGNKSSQTIYLTLPENPKEQEKVAHEIESRLSMLDHRLLYFSLRGRLPGELKSNFYNSMLYLERGREKTIGI